MASMKKHNIIKDFLHSACEPLGGIKGAVIFFSSASAISLAVGIWMTTVEEKAKAEYGNINPEKHLFDNPTIEEQKDIIGSLPTFMRSYYEDDRRIHATYSKTPEYQVIGYLFSGIEGSTPNRCTAAISSLPGFEHVDGKTIITTIDHCIPDNVEGARINFSARFMKEDGTILEFSSPVDLNNIFSFPDYNKNSIRSLFIDKEKAESPAIAFLEINAPESIEPLTINTEWNAREGTPVIDVGNSSDRFGTTMDNKCHTTSRVSDIDYTLGATCHGTKGSSGGPLFDSSKPKDIIAIISRGTSVAKRGDNDGIYVTFPSRKEFDYSSVPWLKKITP